MSKNDVTPNESEKATRTQRSIHPMFNGTMDELSETHNADQRTVANACLLVFYTIPTDKQKQLLDIVEKQSPFTVLPAIVECLFPD